MNETYIIVPKSINIAEFTKSLAMHEIKLFNTFIITSYNLAEISLFKANYFNNFKRIDNVCKSGIYYKIIKEHQYKNFSTHTLQDSINLANTIDSARELITHDEYKNLSKLLDNPPFYNKNKEILDIYDSYNKIKNSKYYIDDIDFKRLAIKKGRTIDSVFYILEEMPLTPLDQQVLKQISNKNFTKISLLNFCKKNISDMHIHSCISAYDYTNEIEYTFENIFSGTNSIDKSCIFLTEIKHYSQAIYDFCATYNIPVTFGCGVPISNSNAANLLKLITKWATTEYFGLDGLLSIINSNSFCKTKFLSVISSENSTMKENEIMNIIKIAGKLRISFNTKLNKTRIKEYKNSQKSLNWRYLKIINNFALEIEKGPSNIIYNYCHVDNCKSFRQNIDKASIEYICSTLDDYFDFCSLDEINQITDIILSKNICKESSKAGHIHISSVDDSLYTFFSNNYFLGLSSNYFPGKLKENYIFLDEDYSCLSNTKYAPTSKNLLSKKINSFKLSISMLSSFGSIINISWSNFNLYNRLEMNSSSVVYDLFPNKNGTNLEISDSYSSTNNVGFFENQLNTSSIFGSLYNKDFITVPKNYKKIEYSKLDNNRFSSSAIETYIKCPKEFYYKYILNLTEPESNNNFEAISSIDRGVLFHDMMKVLANKTMSLSRFKEYGLVKINNYFKENIPLYNNSIQTETIDFVNILEIAYKLEDNSHSIKFAETYLEYKDKKSKIHIYGIPDRIEKSNHNNYIVVDYKTGKIIHQTNNNIESYIQTSLYAYILTNIYKVNVEFSEYKYVSLYKIIKCSFGTDEIKYIHLILNLLKKDLSNGCFDNLVNYNEKLRILSFPSSCSYCPYTNICKADLLDEKLLGVDNE